MSINLYSRKEFHGKALPVNRDLPDLRDTELRGAPTSLNMTADTDRLLLFKQKDYDGACIFRRGKKKISNLGDNDEGGKFGFGNTISSVRITTGSLLM